MEEQIAVTKVEPFDPQQKQVIKQLIDYDTVYFGLCSQMEQTRRKLKALRDIIHKAKKNGVAGILVPWAAGQYRQLKHEDKDEYIKSHMDVHRKLKNSYKGIAGQRQHRADELGEKRMLAFRMLYNVLKDQHDMTHEELVEWLTEKNLRLARENPDLDPIIKSEIEDNKSDKSNNKSNKKEKEKEREKEKEQEKEGN